MNKPQSFLIDENAVYVGSSQLARDARHLLNFALFAKAVGTPPCDKGRGGCVWKDYCRENSVACKNFRSYVRGNLDAEPYTGTEEPSLRLGDAKDV